MWASQTTLRKVGCVLGLVLHILPSVTAIELQVDDPDSLKDAAKTAAKGLMDYYHGYQPGHTEGVFDDATTYSWWILGAAFMELIEYWNLTGDDQYNEIVKSGLLSQIGRDEDFRPDDQVWSEANDDQCYWAFAAMTATEYNFSNPSDDEPSWLSLAQAVFNRQYVEWDDKTCGGGLRWQYHDTGNDFDYKNTPTNGAFFQLAARLAAYTGNDTYAKAAERTFNWMDGTPNLIGDPNKMYSLFDGVYIENDCTKPNKAHWTYNYGTMINGAAYLYKYYEGNAQKQDHWHTRLNAFIKGAGTHFWNDDPKLGGGKYIIEYQCEYGDNCNTDQSNFKGFFLRWLTTAMMLVPDNEINGQIETWLKNAAIGAARQCSGPGEVCGLKWFDATYDGETGVGQQLSAMSVFQNNIVRLAQDRTPFMPLTADTGGTSKSDPSAGTGPTTTPAIPGLNDDDIWSKIKGPVIGSVCGIIAIVLIVVAIFLWRKYWMKPKKVAYKNVEPTGYDSYNDHELDPRLSTPRYAQ